MTTDNITTIEELFTELINNPDLETYGLTPQLVMQLQGQVEESLGLLNDVVDELRGFSPEAVPALKSITLRIFEDNHELESH